RKPAKTPLKVLRLLLLGASSCPEEPSKSMETLDELRASLSTCLTNVVILPLQALLLRSREKLTHAEFLANLGPNLWQQSLQGVLNGCKEVGI
nr:hypothetical protein [Tanacetum cinerariifolium]